MKFLFLIQARLNSSRLPQKILEPVLSETTIIELIYKRVLQCKYANHNNVVILTTDNKIDDKLVEFLKQKDIRYYRGSELNVYSRFSSFIESLEDKPDFFFRVCSDNPFIEPDFLDSLCNSAINTPQADYLSYAASDGVPAIQKKYGLFAELINTQTFTNSNYQHTPYDQEHVTPWLYQSSKFKTSYLPIPAKIEQADINLSVDTATDLAICRNILSVVAKENYSYIEVLNTASHQNKNMNCPLCNNSSVTSVYIGSQLMHNCSTCQLQFVPETGHEAEYHKNYFERFRVNNEQMNELRLKQYEIDAAHFIKQINHGHILDIGCSRGTFMNILNEKGKFDKITGIDIDESAIKYATENNRHANLQYLATDLLSFNSHEQFDAVVFRGTLQYLGSNLSNSFEKIKTLLKKDGLIIVYSLPNADSFIFKLAGENWSLFNPKEHKLFFNESAINYLCRKFNLEIEELTYPYIGTPYENVSKDYNTVIDMIKNGTQSSPPFWGNIIQLTLRAL